MTLEEQLEAALAANEKLTTSVEKLEAQNRKVLEEKKKAAAEADAARDAAEEAAAQAALKNGDVEAVKAAHAKELKKLQEAIVAKDSQIATVLIDNAIQSSLVENGIAPAYHKAVTAMLKSEAQIVDGKAVIGDAPLTDHIKTFVTSDEGKHFVAATANSGAGATGSKATGAVMTKDNFSLTKFMEIAAKNPAEANALADSLGMSHLKLS